MRKTITITPTETGHTVNVRGGANFSHHIGSVYVEYPGNMPPANLADAMLRGAAAAGVTPAQFSAALKRAAGTQGSE